VEVTFDIDANGIVHVSAKDLGTGKEQSIKITASSGLSEEEIDRLVRDAESNAEEDRKKRELVEAKNQADSTVYATEKNLKEMGDKIDAEIKTDIEAKCEAVKTAIEGDDKDAIEKALEELTQASHKLAEAMYSAASEEAATQDEAGAKTGEEAGAEAGTDQGPADDDVVDADFEEVKK
jgi:molecular chaperone DnaK